MTAEHVLERLTEGVAVVTPVTAPTLVLAVVSAHAAEGFSVAVLCDPQRRTQVAPVDRSRWCQALACGCDHHHRVRHLRNGQSGRIGAWPRHGALATQIDTALALMNTHVDTADLLAQLSISIPSVVTPQMFTYQLLDRARSGPQTHRAARGGGRPHPQGGRTAASTGRGPT